MYTIVHFEKRCFVNLREFPTRLCSQEFYAGNPIYFLV